MIWKTKTHLFTATVCQKTGEHCPALARMAEKLAQAMATAAPVTAEDFEIAGSSELAHCPAGCAARFEASHESIRIFCGVDTDADGDRLNRFADMILRPAGRAMPSGLLSQTPCAVLEAIPTERNTAEATINATI